MKSFRLPILLAAVLISVVLTSLRASDAVEPATITITNLRDQAVSAASDVVFYKGATLRFTNCVIYAGSTTSSARQGLTDVAIEVKIGSATTSTAYSGTAQVATSGTWCCDAVIPTNTETHCYAQVKITSLSSTNYIFAWKEIYRKDPL